MTTKTKFTLDVIILSQILDLLRKSWQSWPWKRAEEEARVPGQLASETMVALCARGLK